MLQYSPRHPPWESLYIASPFLRIFKNVLLSSLYVDLNLDILFEKLTAQIGDGLGSGTQLCLEAPGDFWVDIVKMQRLTLV